MSRIVFVIGGIFVALVPVWLVIVHPGITGTHEGIRYLAVGEHFRQALVANSFPPRWLPEFNGGYGYPLFVFYQPAYFYVNALVSLFVEPLYWRYVIAIGVIAGFGSLAVFLLARRYISAWPALTIVLLFQLSPYPFVNIWVRGDISEWMLGQVFPWCLYFLLRRSDPGRALGSDIGLIIASSIALYSHPVGVLLLPIVLSAVLLSNLGLGGKRFDDIRRLQAGVWASLIAILLSAPYWLPVVVNKHLANTQVAIGGQFDAVNHLTSLSSLLLEPLVAERGFQFQADGIVGAPFFLASTVGFWVARREPFFAACFVAYLLLVVGITPIAEPFWGLYPFRLLQFAWRFAVFLPALQIIGIIGLLRRVDEGGFRLPVATRVSLIVLCAHWVIPWGSIALREPATKALIDCWPEVPRIGTPGTFSATLDLGEWLPAGSDARPVASQARQVSPVGCSSELERLSRSSPLLRGIAPPQQGRSIVEFPDSQWRLLSDESATPHVIQLRVSGQTSGYVTLNQLFFPGWIVRVDGKTIADHDLAQWSQQGDGRVRVLLSAGESSVEATFGQPRGAFWASILGCIGLLLTMGYVGVKLRRPALIRPAT